MEKNFWLERWKNQKIGWHQSTVESALIAAFKDVAPTQVLVPLCGKSLDLVWLAEQCHSVFGVELTQQGCQTFFEENSLPFRKRQQGHFHIYESDKIRIFQGDFFELTSQMLPQLGALYDRAALIALPLALRKKYAKHVLEILTANAIQDSFTFLQIVLERKPVDEKGPPFSVSEAELRQYYGSAFKIELLSREKVEMGEEPQVLTEEAVYRLRLC